ncbi:MAG: hypothetical protein WC956_00750 [bacterium]
MRGGGNQVSVSKTIDPAVKAAAVLFREFFKGEAVTRSGDAAASKKGIAVDENKPYKDLTSANNGIVGSSRFGNRAPDASFIGRLGQFLKSCAPSDINCNLLHIATKKCKEGDVVKLFETLIENEAPIVSHYKYRALLTRDEKLEVNQIIRKVNCKIAYGSVDFDVAGVSDEAFWARIDSSQYCHQIENNAAIAMVKMAEKFGILS